VGSRQYFQEIRRTKPGSPPVSPGMKKASPFDIWSSNASVDQQQGASGSGSGSSGKGTPAAEPFDAKKFISTSFWKKKIAAQTSTPAAQVRRPCGAEASPHMHRRRGIALRYAALSAPQSYRAV
jgi:hypothetical protein